MKTWIWPFSLYGRIRELEARVEVLKRKNAELDAQMRAQAIAETSMMIAYTSAISSIAASSVQSYEDQAKKLKRKLKLEAMREYSIARAFDPGET